jgi:hypothetical protein
MHHANITASSRSARRSSDRMYEGSYVYPPRSWGFTLRRCAFSRETMMEDLLWIGVMFGLFAVSLLYIRLCENA